MNQFEQSIFQTLAYFDLADYPLTKEELFAYLWQPPRVGYEEFLLSLRAPEEGAAISTNCHSEFISESLSVSFFQQKTDILKQACSIPRYGVQDDSQKVMIEKFGYYFLPGRDAVVESRRRRLLISEIKMPIARRAAKKLRAIPFLRAVFVCNSVGAGQAAEDSDIDFFIVSAPGRIWIVRFFCNLILRLWCLRTYGAKIKNRICLSFFVDEHHLGLSNLRVAEDDVHFAYWLHQMVPLYDPDNLYEKFLRANNWTDKFLPNLVVPPSLRGGEGGCFTGAVVDTHSSRLWKKLWQAMWRGAYGDLIENQAKQFQMQKMKLRVKEKAQKGDKGVVISDGVIKLHENDTRLAVKAKWDKICANTVIARSVATKQSHGSVVPSIL